MRVILILSSRKVHREENLHIYTAVKKQLKDITWTQGTGFDLDRGLEKGFIYLEEVDPLKFEDWPRGTKFEVADFDIAIIDQSHDMTQDQSPSAFAGIPGFGGSGPANRSLDFQGRDRPSEILRELTARGIVCIGTSRDGRCLDELAGAGAVMTCALSDLPAKLPDFMVEAKRLVEENQNDPASGLKALTLRQPWAWTVFNTTKDVENRQWPAKVRGTIAIHAADEQPAGVYERSKTFIRKVLHSRGHFGVRIPSEDKLPKGAIIGLVDIVDCVTDSRSVWWEGPIGFKLANPRRLPRPIPCRGKRRFFTVPKDVEEQIRALGKI